VLDVNDDSYTVGAVSRLAGVSVRTLHHYDRIGLLAPGGRSAAGYRLYSLADLGRLRQILFYRELGFPLDEIVQIMADPAEHDASHLRRQHRLLRDQIHRRRGMLSAIEKELEARKMGISLTPQEQFEIFGTDQAGGEWARDAGQRWGESAAWNQSQRRTAAYTKQDWVEIQAAGTAVNGEFLDAMRAGEPAGSDRAMAIAEGHRAYLSRWFYDCGHDMHRCLAEMYVNDPRFAQSYDGMAPGLARYIHDAIEANATRSPR
jgi:MerR family transcriptional regulator, thiopeptide resistance regulator